MKTVQVIFLALFAIFNLEIEAREYHVSVSGSDFNTGSLTEPFKTISLAAKLALPGDMVIVHEGIYRERVSSQRRGI